MEAETTRHLREEQEESVAPSDRQLGWAHLVSCMQEPVCKVLDALATLPRLAGSLFGFRFKKNGQSPDFFCA